MKDNIDIVFRPLFRNEPDLAWELVADGLEIDRIRVRLKPWLAGMGVNPSDPAILLIPEPTLWSWVEEDSSRRAPQLAGCAPAFHHDGWWDFTRKMLKRYGEDDEVLEELSTIESGSVFSMEAYQNRRDELRELQKESTDPIVRQWLSQEIRDIEKFLN